MGISRANAGGGDERRTGSASGVSARSNVVEPCWAPFALEINAALQTLLGVRSATSAVDEFSVGTWDTFASQWNDAFGAGSADSLQALFFKKGENDRFLLVAPASTWLLFLDAFLGVDVARLAADQRLWREFVESTRVHPTMTELERAVFLADAPRLGRLNPRWCVSDGESADETPEWKTRYFEERAEKGAIYLSPDLLYWERRTIQLGEKVVPWAVLLSAVDLADAAEADEPRSRSNDCQDVASESLFSSSERRYSVSVGRGGEGQDEDYYLRRPDRRPDRETLRRSFDAESRRREDADGLASGAEYQASQREYGERNTNAPLAAIPLPNLDEPLDNDEEKTLIIRVATGSISLEDWLSLRPGDVLTTDAPADKLFDAVVDDDVFFHVRPGVYKGATAFQIKEKLGSFFAR